MQTWTIKCLFVHPLVNASEFEARRCGRPTPSLCRKVEVSNLLPSGSAGVAAPFPDFFAPAFRFTSLLFRFPPLILVCTDLRSPRLRMAFWWPLLVLALAYAFCRFLLMLIPPSVPSIEVDASDGTYCSFPPFRFPFFFLFCLCSLF